MYPLAHSAGSKPNLGEDIVAQTKSDSYNSHVHVHVVFCVVCVHVILQVLIHQRAHSAGSKHTLGEDQVAQAEINRYNANLHVHVVICVCLWKFYSSGADPSAGS